MLKLLGLLPFVLHFFVGFACFMNVPCGNSNTRVNALTNFEKNVIYFRELFRMAASYDLRYSGFIHSVAVVIALRLFLDQTKRRYSYVYFIGAFIITLIRHIVSKETEYVLPLITSYLFHIPCLLGEDYFNHNKINLHPV